MDDVANVGYLKISNEADRVTVASILFKNGYLVQPARFKKNGKAYEYYVKYEQLKPDSTNGGGNIEG